MTELLSLGSNLQSAEQSSKISPVHIKVAGAIETRHQENSTENKTYGKAVFRPLILIGPTPSSDMCTAREIYSAHTK